VHILLDGREIAKTTIIYKNRFPQWNEVQGSSHALECSSSKFAWA